MKDIPGRHSFNTLQYSNHESSHPHYNNDDDKTNDCENDDVINKEENKRGQFWSHGTGSGKLTFTIWDEVILIILCLFYILDIILDLWISSQFFKSKHPKNGWFVLLAVLVPNLYAGYTSLQWYLRAHDFEPIREPFPWIVRVCFFPLSLLLRYYDAWKFGQGTKQARENGNVNRERRLFGAFLIESAEASMLRLFIIFLEDAPVAVLNLRQVISTPPQLQTNNMGMIIVVLLKLILTMTPGVVHYIKSNKAIYQAAHVACRSEGPSDCSIPTDSSNWQERALLSIQAQFCLYACHLSSVGARLVAYAAFNAALQNKLWWLVIARWIVNIVWIKVDSWEIPLSNCVACGGVYLFTFVPTSPKPQFFRIALFYFLTIFENIIVAVFFKSRLSNNVYGSSALGFIFGGTIISIFLFIVYYKYFHPNKSNVTSFIELKDTYLL